MEEEDLEEDSKVSEGQLREVKTSRETPVSVRQSISRKRIPRGIREKEGESSLCKMTKPKDLKSW